MIERGFRAPWGQAVKVISGGGTVLLGGITAMMIRNAITLPVAVFPAALLLGALLFTIRGYEIQGRELVVRRLLWADRIDLAGLRSARVDPEAMRRSWRLFGNGGLFSISGLYRNQSLGNYRAWAMDPKRSVVLETADRRIVVTPDDPRRFLATLQELGLVRAESPTSTG